MREPGLNFYQLGLCPYRQALSLQQQVHAACVEGRLGGSVLLVEHPPVVTCGQHAQVTSDLRVTPASLEADGVEIIAVERGGQLTAHMPGQLVAYPILPLRAYGLGVKRYIALLEDSVVATLAHYQVPAERLAAYPGVWVGPAKVCAVGVRFKQRVTMHGIALNINNELNLFERFVPCGIRGRGVTSLKQVLGRPLDIAEVSRRWMAEFSQRLEVERYEFGDKTCLEMRI